jgi:rRNA maturation RNase YbeY
VININVYNESSIKYLQVKLLATAVKYVADKEIKRNGEITVIICTDKFIHDLNVKYLGHDYPTDVITFEIDDNPLEGEIYISVETAKMQSLDYKVSLRDEILRLAIHGALHLAGYTDDTDELRMKMSQIEDKYLKEIKAGV